MKKIIVTTTIYKPSKATLKYVEMRDWDFIIVGDLKTPHEDYFKLQYENNNVHYLHPSYQEEVYKELSDAIGWNKVMRRNIGFIEAYKLGADIVATVDDDNIPYDNWGENLVVNQSAESILYETDDVVLDPLSLTNHSHLWHRGFPLESMPNRYNVRKSKDNANFRVMFQADLWDGDPDIDAVCRKIYNPTELSLSIVNGGGPFTSSKYIPFNSQNTFIAREALPHYMVLPFVGRMDDIWGGYIAQYLLDTRPVFMPATVYQDRNDQDINKNLRDEVLGYTTTYKLLKDIENWRNYLPAETLNAFDIYRNEFTKYE